MTTRKRHDPYRAARSPLGGSILSLQDCLDKEADSHTGVGTSTGLSGHYSTGHLLKLMTRTCTKASDIRTQHKPGRNLTSMATRHSVIKGFAGVTFP